MKAPLARCMALINWPSCVLLGGRLSGGDALFLVSDRLVLDQQRPLPDRRSYMLTVRHALTRKLTRSKTMQW